MYLQSFGRLKCLLFLTLLVPAMSGPARVLAAPSPGKDFSVADLGQWRISGSGAGKLKASVQDGTLILHWPGGAGQAIIEHNQQATITPALLSEGYLRYVCRLNLPDSEYGSELSVQLQPIRTNGKPGQPYFMRPAIYGATGHVMGQEGSMGGLYAPPGEWARVDFNYKPPSGMAAVRPRFVLQGNAMTVAIKQATIEKGLTWTRGRNPALPEARDFDEKRVTEILSGRRRAVPRLVRRAGRVALEVNGNDVFPACYTRGTFYPQYTRYREFAKAGYNLVRVAAHLNPLSATHKAGVGNLWRAKDHYDFSELERELKVIANINPNALVIVSTTIMPYHGWAGENPDSIVTNQKGEKLIVYGGEALQYGGVPDTTTNREADYAPSFYGGRFPEDAANAVGQLAAFLQKSEAGKIVIGVEFTGGTDGQIYPWDRDGARGADYSPAGLAGWRKFLRLRYNDDIARLRRDWDDATATFEGALVPGLTERGYGNSTAVSRRGFDYNEFVSQAIADFMIGLGTGLKKGSDGRLLAGVYYSDSGEQGAIARGALSQILQSRVIDMGRSVMRHQTSGSWWRHGKLTWLELDMRPPMPSPMQYFTAGLEYTPAYFETLVWRNAVMALTDLRGGFYPYDMAESWYQDPDIIKTFGKVRAGIQECLDDNVNIAPAVGVFADEHLPFRLPGTLGYQLTRTSAIGIYRALDRSGVPYTRFLLEEALDPAFTLPPVCIFRLPLALTAEQLKTVQDKAKGSGSILVWEYAPGQPLKNGDIGINGFQVKMEKAAQNLPLSMQDAGPLTAGMANTLLGTPLPPISLNDNLRWNGLPTVILPRAGDTVLARYAGTSLAGVVLHEQNGLKQIMIGKPGTLSPQFIRNLAQNAGIQPLSTDNDEMRFGSGILGFYAERGGKRNIVLPRGFKVAASPTGHNYQATPTGFTFTIGYRDMAVFKIVKNQ